MTYDVLDRPGIDSVRVDGPAVGTADIDLVRVAHSAPAGRSSYRGLNSTAFSPSRVTRPKQTIARPGSMPRICRRPSHTSEMRAAAVVELRDQRGHSGTRAQRHGAQGAGDADPLAVGELADQGGADLDAVLLELGGLVLLGRARQSVDRATYDTR